MANYSRWEDIKKNKGVPAGDARAGIEQDLDLGQLIYDLRTDAGLSQRELADRMGTTQSVISRLEEEVPATGSPDLAGPKIATTPARSGAACLFGINDYSAVWKI